MELPTLGRNCFEKTCKQLDFLPMKCDACSNIFCKEHILYSQHQCDAAYKKDVQVPVCPLCNKPIPVNRGETPDIKVSSHIDTDCQSDPAKEKRRAFSNKCSLKGCKRKELVPVLCSSCRKNFCLRHRIVTDHNCEGSSNSANLLSRQRGMVHSSERQQTFPKEHRRTEPPIAARSQAGLSDDEAFRRAIQMSLAEQQTPGRTATQQQQHEQEEADQALARALQESEQEEQKRRLQMQSTDQQQQNSGSNKCSVS